MSPWDETIPGALRDRAHDVEAAAMHLAYAARSFSGVCSVTDYWRTLPALLQQVWILRAVDNVSRARGIKC